MASATNQANEIEQELPETELENLDGFLTDLSHKEQAKLLLEEGYYDTVLDLSAEGTFRDSTELDYDDVVESYVWIRPRSYGSRANGYREISSLLVDDWDKVSTYAEGETLVVLGDDWESVFEAGRTDPSYRDDFPADHGLEDVIEYRS